MAKLLYIYLFSSRMLLPYILPYLSKEDEISHEQFKVRLEGNGWCLQHSREWVEEKSTKCEVTFFAPTLGSLQGALYVLLTPILVMSYTRDWALLRKLLPVIIKVSAL